MKHPENKTYGLVVCGGNSTRMGTDKSRLQYFNKPQCYYVYDLLQPFCDRVFISCNATQETSLDSAYNLLPDLSTYANIGPMAALLTAFETHPGADFLVIGCDYPFVTATHIQSFIQSYTNDGLAAAFYNQKHQVYEPLLAWYAHQSAGLLKQMFNTNQYSLQHFLKANYAAQFVPSDAQVLTGIDTPGAFANAKAWLTKQNNG